MIAINPALVIQPQEKAGHGDLRISMKGAVNGEMNSQNQAPRLCLGARLSTSVWRLSKGDVIICCG